MKKVFFLTFVLLCTPVFASEVVPSRIIVKWLARAVQNQKPNEINSYFVFNEKEHSSLTPLSREQQLQLLEDLPLDEIKFDKDEYDHEYVGERFVVSIVSPVHLDFEMQHVEYEGGREFVAPWSYKVLAIRKSSQQTQTYTVDKVIDCKTLKLSDGQEVSLIGLQCPEGEMGKEATEFVKGLGLEGKEVRLEFDAQKKDKYGRTLAYVYVDVCKQNTKCSHSMNSAYEYKIFDDGHMTHPPKVGPLFVIE